MDSGRLNGPSLDDADELTRHLAALADQLDGRERRLLERVLATAMTPLERLRHLDAPGVLTAEEQRVLGDLTGSGE